jgi:hypothetical protein
VALKLSSHADHVFHDGFQKARAVAGAAHAGSRRCAAAGMESLAGYHGDRVPDRAAAWWGLAIVVQCNRVNDSRVDVTVQRRFVGLIPFSTETVPDVVKADVYNVWARTSGGGKQRRGSTAALELTSRQGQVVRRTRFGPSFGTEPSEMADQIQLVLNDRSRASVTGWWMPWLVNIAALLFVLVVGSILGEVVLRALGVLKPAS